MRNINTMLFLISLSLTTALIFPNLGRSNQFVDRSGCMVEGCHNIHNDFTANHSSNCRTCHGDNSTRTEPVAAGVCIECHPLDDAGKCQLVLHHEDSILFEPESSSCLDCHGQECEGGGTTTTTTTTLSSSTTTTVSSEICPIEKIYGEHSEEVELLKFIRDHVLSKTLEGQEIIGLYYEWSPVLVKAMEEDDKFKEEVREMIDGILMLIEKELE